ncbi:TIGD4 [Branchiostoma lanceolatum]|uniref:TIGD4 protein n=1 Tax=Branchiostoma lanceolatum TaxID=7740 RepID=A0A8K0E7L3_BRALA|nr:TIGD4 [Branchiostoma lanceolatum]
MTREAWRNVQPLTIQNCFRKAGLTTVVQPEDSATPQPADIAVPIPEGMTEEEFNEFVDLDADVECTGDPSEEEICQEVRESRGTTFTKTEAEDDVDFESSPPPVPSSAAVSTALDVLRRWMQCSRQRQPKKQLVRKSYKFRKDVWRLFMQKAWYPGLEVGPVDDGPAENVPVPHDGPAVNSPEACTMLTHAVETWFSAKKRHGSKKLGEGEKQQERVQRALIKLRQLYGEEEADVTMADPETAVGEEEAELKLKVLEKENGVPFMALTATATKEVQAIAIEKLKNPKVVKDSLDRREIFLVCKKVTSMKGDLTNAGAVSPDILRQYQSTKDALAALETSEAQGAIVRSRTKHFEEEVYILLFKASCF